MTWRFLECTIRNSRITAYIVHNDAHVSQSRALSGQFNGWYCRRFEVKEIATAFYHEMRPPPPKPKPKPKPKPTPPPKPLPKVTRADLYNCKPSLGTCVRCEVKKLCDTYQCGPVTLCGDCRYYARHGRQPQHEKHPGAGNDFVMAEDDMPYGTETLNRIRHIYVASESALNVHLLDE